MVSNGFHWECKGAAELLLIHASKQQHGLMSTEGHQVHCQLDKASWYRKRARENRDTQNTYKLVTAVCKQNICSEAVPSYVATVDRH